MVPSWRRARSPAPRGWRAMHMHGLRKAVWPPTVPSPPATKCAHAGPAGLSTTLPPPPSPNHHGPVTPWNQRHSGKSTSPGHIPRAEAGVARGEGGGRRLTAGLQLRPHTASHQMAFPTRPQRGADDSHKALTLPPEPGCPCQLRPPGVHCGLSS